MSQQTAVVEICHWLDFSCGEPTLEPLKYPHTARTTTVKAATITIVCQSQMTHVSLDHNVHVIFVVVARFRGPRTTIRCASPCRYVMYR
jgi:hypothetical protein